jgi:hypothetical protein
MSRSVIPLDVIVSDCASDLGDSVGKSKIKLTRHILDGYRILNMFLDGKTEVKSLVLEFSNVINMPCDFQYVTKVAVRRPGATCFAILSVCNSVERRVLSDTDTCNYLNNTWSGAELGPQYTFYNAWGLRGNYYGELYGIGRGVVNSGTYSIDKSEGIIYLGGNLPPDSEIIIEYVGNGLANGLVMVPMELKECLQYYAKFRYYADKNPNLAQLNEAWYKKEYNKLKRYYNHQNPINFAAKINSYISPTNY